MSQLVAYQIANNVQIIGAHFVGDAQGDLFFFSDPPAAVVHGDSGRLCPHNPATIPPAMQMNQQLSGGIQITSTSTPALDGTYAVDPMSQSDIIAIETSINAGKGFPGRGTAFNYPDASGALHSFTEANFTNFAAAIRDYVYAAKSVIGGTATALPSPAVTIA